MQATLAELSRREAAHRRTEHGRLCNRVLALGNIVKTEKISYRAWQRSFGRSVAKRAPGLFVSLLRRNVPRRLPYFFDEINLTDDKASVVDLRPPSRRYHR